MWAGRHRGEGWKGGYIYGSQREERRVLAATQNQIIQKASGVWGVNAVATLAGTAAGRGTYAAAQRGTRHKALCFVAFVCVAYAPSS